MADSAKERAMASANSMPSCAARRLFCPRIGAPSFEKTARAPQVRPPAFACILPCAARLCQESAVPRAARRNAATILHPAGLEKGAEIGVSYRYSAAIPGRVPFDPPRRGPALAAEAAAGLVLPAGKMPECGRAGLPILICNLNLRDPEDFTMKRLICTVCALSLAPRCWPAAAATLLLPRPSSSSAGDFQLRGCGQHRFGGQHHRRVRRHSARDCRHCAPGRHRRCH